MKYRNPLIAANKIFERLDLPPWYLRDRCLENARMAKTKIARERLLGVANVIEYWLVLDEMERWPG